MRKIAELGRSMVEILGVLAVIGVLSLVGISGYKKSIAKARANEVLDMFSKLYTEAQARAFLNPSMTAVQGNIFSNALPDSLTGDYAISLTNNLGMEKPTWAKNLNFFSLRLSMKPSSGTVAQQTYRNLYIYGLGSCDVCNELKSYMDMTKTCEDHCLILAGSVQGTLTGGVRVKCTTGSSTSPAGTQCF